MFPAGPRLTQSNPLQQIGHMLLCLYLFLAYSRLAEQKFPSLHIPGLVFAALLLFLIAPGVLSSFVSHSVGRYFLLFNVLLLLSVPFSVWRRGSFEFLATTWWRAFPQFALVLGLTLDFGQVVRTVKVIALAILCLSALVISNQIEILGRIAIGNSRYGDPNYVAMILLFGITLWISFALGPGASLPKCLVAVAAILPMAYIVARTGSRGGLLSAAIIVLYSFFHSSLKGKIALVLAAVSLAGIGALSLDESIRNRYLTVFSNSQAQDRDLGAAVASAESRRYLLMRSIELTIRNPLFGVGVNMFPVAENGVAVEAGMRKGLWHVTHNMYTQVSSENGIPALICFLAVLAGSWKSLSRVTKAASGHSSPRAADIAKLAFCLKLSLLSLMATGTFLSIAYDDLFAVVPALIIALERVARREGLLEPSATGTAPVSLPVPHFPRPPRRNVVRGRA